MPVLASERTTKRINLSRFPESDPGWIEIYDRAQVGDVEAVGNLASGQEIGKITEDLMLVTSLIKDWNFTESDGSSVPITLESVRRLEMSDLNDIAEAMKAVSTELSTEKKSDSSLTSKPKPIDPTA